MRSPGVSRYKSCARSFEPIYSEVVGGSSLLHVVKPVNLYASHVYRFLSSSTLLVLRDGTAQEHMWSLGGNVYTGAAQHERTISPASLITFGSLRYI
jgi:hypothetical protein